MMRIGLDKMGNHVELLGDEVARAGQPQAELEGLDVQALRDRSLKKGTERARWIALRESQYHVRLCIPDGIGRTQVGVVHLSCQKHGFQAQTIGVRGGQRGQSRGCTGRHEG